MKLATKRFLYQYFFELLAKFSATYSFRHTSKTASPTIFKCRNKNDFTKIAYKSILSQTSIALIAVEMSNLKFRGNYDILKTQKCSLGNSL